MSKKLGVGLAVFTVGLAIALSGCTGKYTGPETRLTLKYDGKKFECIQYMKHPSGELSVDPGFSAVFEEEKGDICLELFNKLFPYGNNGGVTR